MSNYIPKLSHAVMNALLGILFVALLANDTRYADAFLVGAITFLLMTAMIFALLFSEQRRSYYHSMAYFAEQLAKLNPDQWEALGIKFPHLRIKWNGKPIKFFEDTSATMEDFERFMRDSDGKQISPERNWSSGPQRRAWVSIHAWLNEAGYIFHNSAAGNHSWLWRGNMYAILWQRYIDSKDHELVNLGEMEAGT